MPVYEYYCRSCESKFEKLRPIAASDQPAECPAGHTGATRTITVFATLRGGTDAEPLSMAGGCGCGGACACAAGRN